MSQRSLQSLVLRHNAVLLVLFVLMCLLSFSMSRAYLLEQRHTEQLRSLSSKAGHLAHFVEFYRDIIKSAVTPQLVDLIEFGDRDAAEKWARSIRKLVPDSVGLALLDADGNVLGNPLSLRLGTRCVIDMHALANDGTLSANPPVHDEVSGLEHFDIVEPVMSDGEVIGLLFASFRLDVVERALSRVAEEGEALGVVTAGGKFIAGYGEDMALDNMNIDDVAVPGTDWHLHAARRAVDFDGVFTRIAVMNGLLFVIVSMLIYLFARRLIRIVSVDLDAIRGLLEQIHSNPHTANSLEARSQLRETDVILGEIHDLAGEIGKRQVDLIGDSTTDELTGLLNRRGFTRELQRCIELARRDVEGVVVAVDLDHLKRINDTLGHAAGDAVIRQVGQCLKAHSRVTDVCARTGGDEFFVVLMKCRQDQAQVWFDKVLAAFLEAQRHLPELGGTDKLCTLSAGCTQIQDGEHEIHDAMTRADSALYEAKAAGRGLLRRYGS